MKRGFTLIELSIVLVIIALLVGGVMAGKELIAQAELRRFANQIKALENAAILFREKFNCLPGDCARATQFWGQRSACGLTTAVGYEAATCNGDGNGMMIMNTQNRPSAESYYFWHHLSRSGLIEGNYWGARDVNAPATICLDYSIIGTALVEATIKPAGIQPAWLAAAGQHSFQIGMPIANFGISCGFLSPAEIIGLEHKYDDGFYTTGKIRGQGDKYIDPATGDWTHGTYGCLNGGTGNTYSTTYLNNPKICAMRYMLNF